MDLRLDILTEEERSLKKRMQYMSKEEGKDGAKEEQRQLYVQLFWADYGNIKKEPSAANNMLIQTWEQEFTEKIANELRSRYFNLQNAFMIFDRGFNGQVSREDFKTTVKGVLGMHSILDEELDKYYDRLPKPYDWEKFLYQYKPFLEPRGKVTGLTQFDDLYFQQKEYPEMYQLGDK